jgi:hypothetical protein
MVLIPKTKKLFYPYGETPADRDESGGFKPIG